MTSLLVSNIHDAKELQGKERKTNLLEFLLSQRVCVVRLRVSWVVEVVNGNELKRRECGRFPSQVLHCLAGNLMVF